VVVVHPNNPTGSFVKAGEAELLNRFCRAHGLAVIADEVFLDYGLDESPSDVAPQANSRFPSASSGRALHKPLDRLSPIQSLDRNDKAKHGSFAENHDVLTFTLSGVSKISALPQMKVAWVVTSGPEAEVGAAIERLEVIADTYLSMNAPVQWAVPVLLEQRKNIQRQLMERVRGNLAELDRQLAEQTTCSRLRVEGGWYAVLRVPVTRSDEELAIELVREKAVVAHPGHFFDFPSDGYLVLSLITAEQEFGEGVRRVLEIV
jgi:aspartate/methionine/tyrosine aminotransferase